MKLKTEKYKGIEIEYEVYPDGLFSASALDSISTGVFSDLTRVKQRIEERIDAFLIRTPTSYAELAEAIEDVAVWTSYEQMEIRAENIKPIIENFIKAGGK